MRVFVYCIIRRYGKGDDSIKNWVDMFPLQLSVIRMPMNYKEIINSFTFR